MPSLERYSRGLSYSYAPGLFPAHACLASRPEQIRRLLLHSQAGEGEGMAKLIQSCQAKCIRVETADRALRQISGKENCYAALVFDKYQDQLQADRCHVVLHNPSDRGNLGTALRSLLGFGLRNLAIIRPGVDPFDPQVVRASMGALFALRIAEYPDFDAYRAEFPQHGLYPFMLDASAPLDQVASEAKAPYSLIFGNEATGLPEGFAKIGQPVRIPHNQEIDSLNLAVAVSIGAYGFSQGGGGHDGF